MSDEPKNLGRLVDDYNIHFDSRLSTSQWPAEHAKVFRDLAKSAAFSYEDYTELAEKESLEKPWRIQIRRQADEISKLARQCRSESQNEAGWRLVLEYPIFRRFQFDIACPSCKGRLWRSEIETSYDEDRDGYESLRQRRETRREPCRCPLKQRDRVSNDVSLNPLFSERAEESIVHEDVALPKQRPDRVYGLRKNKLFSSLLNAQSASGRQVRDIVKCTPFKEAREFLLFPFLIIEAKSAKGPDSFDQIEMQTAFPIRTALRMQEDLQKQNDRVITSPLVWFFAYRGDEWRVYAGFCERQNSNTTYRVIDLWHGFICDPGYAIQLLLIVDNIFDWARDNFRRSVVESLTRLSAKGGEDTASIYPESDIPSMSYPIGPWIHQLQPSDDFGNTESTDLLENGEMNQPSNPLDSYASAFRDASIVFSEYFGLYITGDNVNTILSSQTKDKAVRFSRQILKALRDERVTLSEAQLESIERLWTGNVDCHPHNLASPRSFHVRLIFRTWLTESWDQIRELCCLAVSADAEDILWTTSRLKEKDTFQSFIPFPGSVETACRQLRSKSIPFNLRAAISRTALALDIEKRDNVATGKVVWIREFTSRKKDKTKVDCAYDKVHQVYKDHKKARLEPTESFIRHSSRIDQQKSISQKENISYQNSGLVEVTDDIYITKGTVPVIGQCERLKANKRKVEGPESCFYLLSGPPEVRNIPALIKDLVNMAQSPLGHRTYRCASNKAVDTEKWNLSNDEVRSINDYEYFRAIACTMVALHNEAGSYPEGLTEMQLGDFHKFSELDCYYHDNGKHTIKRTRVRVLINSRPHFSFGYKKSSLNVSSVAAHSETIDLAGEGGASKATEKDEATTIDLTDELALAKLYFEHEIPTLRNDKSRYDFIDSAKVEAWIAIHRFRNSLKKFLRCHGRA